MKIGLAQTDIIWEEKEKNKQKAESFIIEGKEKEIDFILFPEMSMTGFSMNVKLVGESAGELFTVDFFRKKAKEYEMAIGVGYILLKGGRAYNNYAIIDKNGQLMCDYSKIHPFSYGKESEHYTGGNHICSCTLEGIKVTPFICYDLRFPEIFLKASEEAQLIVVPANWPDSRAEHWDILLKARAVENQCYIAGINRTGSGDGLRYSGRSVLFDPYGNQMTKISEQEKLITGEVDIYATEACRSSFPVKNDRRNVIYKQFY